MNKGKNMFECKECNKEFSTYRGLNAHQVVHKKRKKRYKHRKKVDKTFECLNCGTVNQWSHSNHNKFCNTTCFSEYRKKEWLLENRELYERGELKSRKAIKKFHTLDYGYECAICKSPAEHNGKPLSLILDHIDGDASNNMPDNFRLVCPNCDSQLPTFKSRNRGKGRGSRGMDPFGVL